MLAAVGVLDVTSVVMGPLATQGDMGADVIGVEPPSGERSGSLPLPPTELGPRHRQARYRLCE
jgi:crotonobetainyl-CoA:carnitine CoA-transferase CaiB-like acyl-CoA transferase